MVRFERKFQPLTSTKNYEQFLEVRESSTNRDITVIFLLLEFYVSIKGWSNCISIWSYKQSNPVAKLCKMKIYKKGWIP